MTPERDWWFNDRRLMEPLGYPPPAAYEMQCALAHVTTVVALTLQPASLPRTQGGSIRSLGDAVDEVALPTVRG